MEFTEEQLKILDHNPARHARILAGPGSGKSLTIITYLSELRKRNPDINTRLLTFTRAANAELLSKMKDADIEPIATSTIHSFAMSILLQNPEISGLPLPLRICDNWELRTLIHPDLSRRLNVGVKLIKQLEREMNASWESLLPGDNEAIPPEIRSRFLGLWDEHRRIFGYSLLSELLFRLKLALDGNPDLYTGQIDLVAIDEYQDLNACDMSCVWQMAIRGSSIMAIGDDDQSIYYGLRKAKPSGIRNFVTDYKADDYPLTKSYRCARPILEWSNFVILGDTGREPKQTMRFDASSPEGTVAYLSFGREYQEAQGIVRLINWLLSEKEIKPEDILILARSDVFIRLIKTELANAGFPYMDPSEFLNALYDPMNRHLIAELHLLLNRNDSLAWWTKIKLIHRLGPSIVDHFYHIAREKNAAFGDILLSQAMDRFQSLKTQKHLLSSQVESIISSLESIEVPSNAQWGEWIIQQAQKAKVSMPSKDFIEILATLDKHHSAFDSITLNQFVNQMEPTMNDIMNAKSAGFLRIMTLRRSKGLTVRAVIVAGVEDGVIPHPGFDRQEERRLLYVGMTRAREYTFLTRSRVRIDSTAYSGRKNVGRGRGWCPFLIGGPVQDEDGEAFLSQLNA